MEKIKQFDGGKILENSKMILTTTDSLFRRFIETEGELTAEEKKELENYDASILNNFQ